MSTDDKDNSEDGNNSNVLLEDKVQTKKPSLYQVLIMNDDYTPMEFVILVLENILVNQEKKLHKLCYMFIKKE